MSVPYSPECEKVENGFKPKILCKTPYAHGPYIFPTIFSTSQEALKYAGQAILVWTEYKAKNPQYKEMKPDELHGEALAFFRGLIK